MLSKIKIIHLNNKICYKIVSGWQSFGVKEREREVL